MAISQVAQDGSIGPAASLPGQPAEAGRLGGADAETVGRTRAATAIPSAPAPEVGPVRTRETPVGRPGVQPQVLLLAASRRLRTGHATMATPRSAVRARRAALLGLAVGVPQVPSIVDVDGRRRKLRLIEAVEAHVVALVRLHLEVELEADGVRSSTAMAAIALPDVRPAAATNVSAATQPPGCPAGQTRRRKEEDPVTVVEEVPPAVLRTPGVRHPVRPRGQVGLLRLQLLECVSERLETDQQLSGPANVVALSMNTPPVPSVSPCVSQGRVLEGAAPVARRLAEEAGITSFVGRQVGRPQPVDGAIARNLAEPDAALRVGARPSVPDPSVGPPALPATIPVPVTLPVGLLRVAPSTTSMGPSIAEPSSRGVAAVVHGRAAPPRGAPGVPAVVSP